jgi:hypothetical protein
MGVSLSVDFSPPQDHDTDRLSLQHTRSPSVREILYPGRHSGPGRDHGNFDVLNYDPDRCSLLLHQFIFAQCVYNQHK